MKRNGLILLLCCALLLSACGRKEAPKEKEYAVYYVDKEENKVCRKAVYLEEKDTRTMLQSMFYELKTQPDDASCKSAIPEGVELTSFSYEEGQLILHFDKEYARLSPTAEVLSRAAIVRTLCQIDGVDYVAFTVDGEALVNFSGVPVGYMTADQFVDNAGNEISAYERATLTLYYANAAGNRLEAHMADCIYNSNISLDKLVVEKLIAGPEEGESVENGYATLAENTQVMGVTTRDNICYVNLSEDFLNVRGNVTPEVAVYSIVNSLAELSGVNKVQISVNGNTDLIFMEKIPLSQVFERNLEIMENAQ